LILLFDFSDFSFSRALMSGALMSGIITLNCQEFLELLCRCYFVGRSFVGSPFQCIRKVVFYR